MAYWRIFFHFVWGTRHRLPLITPEVETVIYPVIAEKARELGAGVYALNGTADHVHLALALPPRCAPADVIGQIKGRSSYVVTHQHHLDFGWQSGYGVLSFGEKHLPWVIRYVENQKTRHAAGKLAWPLETREDDDNGPAGIIPDQ